MGRGPIGVAALDVVILTRFNAPRFVSEIMLAGGYVVVLIAIPAHVGLNITGLIATSAVVTSIVWLIVLDGIFAVILNVLGF